jgi:23S rRNA pseudouridine2605 synthase
MVKPIAEHVSEKERIAKRLSRAGVCSRREAERWIAEGRISLNGARVTTPATLVSADDVILADGKPVAAAEETRLFRYHKPVGLVTTRSDERGRETVFDRMPAELPRLISVGRLDLTSEGLLLLTNNGALSRYLELPATGWPRRYRVRAHGIVAPSLLERLKRGVTVEGVRYGPIEAVPEKNAEKEARSNSWLMVSLNEGKNREIRKAFAHVGLTVNRLIRVGYGPFQLGKLPVGAIEEVPKRVLKEYGLLSLPSEKTKNKP